MSVVGVQVGADPAGPHGLEEPVDDGGGLAVVVLVMVRTMRRISGLAVPACRGWSTPEPGRHTPPATVAPDGHRRRGHRGRAGATDIVGVITKYTQLRRSGQRWVGLCPFHAREDAVASP